MAIPLAVATFLAGEFLAPPAERLAQQVRVQSQGQGTRIVAQQFQSGFWFKQDQTFVNIKTLLADMTLLGVRIYEFDRNLRLNTLRVAEQVDLRLEFDRLRLPDFPVSDAWQSVQ